MQDEENEFQSTEVFVDDEPEIASSPSPEEVYEKEFDAAAASPNEQAEIEVKAPVKLIAGMTDEELKAILDKAKRFDELDSRLTKAADKNFGQIGQIQKELNDLKQSRAQAPQATPVTKDTFKSLNDYFGDDELGKALANDLAQLQLGGSQGFDEDRFNAALSAAEEKLERKFEERLVTHKHPDWREILVTPEFTAWKASLPEQTQVTLFETYDSTKINKAFDSFKDWKNKKAEHEQKKKRRLENAIPLETGGKSERQVDKNYEDAFNEGMKKAAK